MKTNFNIAEIKAEEDYKNYPLPIAYDFKSVDARERILYMNYNRVEADVDQRSEDSAQVPHPGRFA